MYGTSVGSGESSDVRVCVGLPVSVHPSRPTDRTWVPRHPPRPVEGLRGRTVPCFPVSHLSGDLVSTNSFSLIDPRGTPRRPPPPPPGTVRLILPLVHVDPNGLGVLPQPPPSPLSDPTLLHLVSTLDSWTWLLKLPLLVPQDPLFQCLT